MEIGLDYICKIYNMEFKELAIRMKTTPQNLNAWLRRKRSIPPKRIDQLVDIFPKIPPELFGKELLTSEKLLIQEIYYTETDEWEVEEYEESDDQGNVFTNQFISRSNEDIINVLRDQRERQKLLEEYEEIIFDEEGTYRLNEKLLRKFKNILKGDRESKQFSLMMLMFYFTQPYESDFGFGSDPDFSPSEKELRLYEEFRVLLSKYDFKMN
ncbi:hypothetical protein [Paenibacillus silvae]|uniref:Uncharacterized protein n=1 Tax=Paenibacillus silvae TaxID=1325358 RepID=A0A2W6NEF5_9BACL|nr:hypothetical protein [Paenibacillus silvae]PZT54354.1 hypothetical protein DN757_17650 [Paenibacillus silvae]